MNYLKRAVFAIVFALCCGAATAFAAGHTATATFAGGCFWCVESDFDGVTGVLKTVSGYIGGETENPTYKNHTSAKHLEAVEITFDPSIVTFAELLNVFWRSVDPVDEGGQFCDRGHSYTTAIFAADDEQHEQALSSKTALDESGRLGKPIATAIRRADTFWPAEDYHQDYYEKNPTRYKLYRYGCGRDKRVTELWGDEAHAGITKH